MTVPRCTRVAELSRRYLLQWPRRYRPSADNSKGLDPSRGSGLRFNDRGSQTLKGFPGEWHLYAVER